MPHALHTLSACLLLPLAACSLFPPDPIVGRYEATLVWDDDSGDYMPRQHQWVRDGVTWAEQERMIWTFFEDGSIEADHSYVLAQEGHEPESEYATYLGEWSVEGEDTYFLDMQGGAPFPRHMWCDKPPTLSCARVQAGVELAPFDPQVEWVDY